MKSKVNIDKDMEQLAQEARKYKSVEDWEKSYSENISNEKSPIKEKILEGYEIRKNQGYIKTEILSVNAVKTIRDIEIREIDVLIKWNGGDWHERYVVASKEDKIIGAADGQKNADGITLLRIAVDKEFQRNGIGTEIVKVFGGTISPRGNEIMNVSLAGLKTALRAKGYSLTDFYNHAVGKHEPELQKETPTNYPRRKDENSEKSLEEKIKELKEIRRKKEIRLTKGRGY